MSKRKTWACVFVAALSCAGTGWAATAAATSTAATSTAAAAPAQEALTRGEVRKVDMEQGKLTIKHEAIANLDMPPMTMVFRAGKPEHLAGLKAGDKILFRVESVNGAISTTRVEKAK